MAHFKLRPLAMDLSRTNFAKLLPKLPLSKESKGLFLQEYYNAIDRDAALLKTAKDINAFFAHQMSKSTSEAAYSKRGLEVYDQLVWQFNSPFLWRIEQQDIEGLYSECVGEKHCEVAVGTGLFLTQPTKTKRISLVDLNPNTLQITKRRLTALYPEHVPIISHVADILQTDLKSATGTSSFDSIAANFLIHCLHGGKNTAQQAFSNIASALSPTGVFFGSTILGNEMIKDGETVAGKAGLETLIHYNKLGIFGNLDDSMESITEALNETFDQVEVWRIGYCALWKATVPKNR